MPNIRLKSVYYFIIGAFILFSSCKTDESFNLEKILADQSGLIKQVLNEQQDHQLQILCTIIHRTNEGIVTFSESVHNLNEDQYFYPASTVKLPVSILVLEKLNELENVDLDTPYRIGEDTTSYSFRKDMQEIFSISGNAPYNRLLAFLGFEYINGRLSELGFSNSRITHKLSESGVTPSTFDTLKFHIPTGKINVHQAFKSKREFVPHDITGTHKGLGFIRNDSLIKGSFDFSQRNRYSLSDIHETIKRIYFPSLYSESEQFSLTDEQYKFLKQSMSVLPRELDYDTNEYYDSYGKFFLFGDSKNPIPPHMKIHNKVGYAYGTLTDSAYIIDEKNGVSFILSATILVNENQVFNDGVYEYDDTGIPFLAELGRIMHSEILRLKESDSLN